MIKENLTGEQQIKTLKQLLKNALSFIPNSNDARLAEDYEEHWLRTEIKEALATELTTKEQLYFGLRTIERAVLKDKTLTVDEFHPELKTYRSDIEWLSRNSRVATRIIYVLSRLTFGFVDTDPKNED